MRTDAPTESRVRNSANRWTKPVVFCVAILSFFLIYWRYGDALTLQSLAEHEQTLRAYEHDHPWEVVGGAFLLYVIISGLSIPGGAVALSLVFGSYFGWGRAVLIVSFASTAGATIAFLTSRYLFRDFIQDRFGDRLVVFNEKLEEEGAFYLFSLRLIPAVPFFMLNLVMGLTKMKTRTYWWVSQIGMLAGTMAYVYAGSTVKLPALAEDGFQGLGWEFVAAFVVLGVLPIAIKKLMGYVRANKNEGTATAA